MRFRDIIVLLLAIPAGVGCEIAAQALELEGLSANAIVWAGAVLFTIIAVPLSLGLGERTTDRPAHHRKR
jgi:hypothetical protein